MHRIVTLLRDTVIPWTVEDARQRLVVARSVMQRSALPPGVSLSSRPLRGKRIVIKNRRHFANHRIFSAEWPQSNQQEMLLPKIACVVSGTADYLLGNYCLHACEGTFIFIPPDAPHHCRGPFLDADRVKTGECTLLFCYAYSHGIHLWFSRSAAGSHVNDMADSYLIPDMAAVQMLHLAMEEAVAGEAGSGAICKSLLFAFYSVITRDVEAGYCMRTIGEPVKEIKSLSDEDFVSRIEEYIRANLHKRLKVTDVARYMFMSPSHFSRTLHRKAGKSFVELLTMYRIQRAKELLVNSDWTVAYIAGYVGLKSPAYFHEFFQRHVKCTPLEYRRNHQK